MENIFTRAAKFLKEQRLHKRWKKIVSALAAAVVFCTTYALILPAMTAERPTYCGMEAHTHTEECFENGVQICGKQEHTHTEECYSQTSGASIEAVGDEDRSMMQAAADPGTDIVIEGVDGAVMSDADPVLTDEGTALDQLQIDIEDVSTEEKAQVKPQDQLIQELAALSLTGNWAQDIVMTAKTFVGSEENSIGFISRVLAYDKVEGIPEAKDEAGNFIGYAEWLKKIRKAGLYEDNTCIPGIGDLVFIDRDDNPEKLEREDERIDHAGIVISVRTRKNEDGAETLRDVMVLTDDPTGRIDSFFYNMKDPMNVKMIAGYAKLPEQNAQADIQIEGIEHAGDAVLLDEGQGAAAVSENGTDPQQSETAAPAATEKQSETAAPETTQSETGTPETAQSEMTAQSGSAAPGTTPESEAQSDTESQSGTPETQAQSDTEVQSGTPETQAQSDTEVQNGTPETTQSETGTTETQAQSDTEDQSETMTEDGESELTTESEIGETLPDGNNETEQSETEENGTAPEMTEMPTETDTEMSSEEDTETESETEMSTNADIETTTEEQETETEGLTGEPEIGLESETGTEGTADGTEGSNDLTVLGSEQSTEDDTEMSSEEDTETESETEMSTNEDIESESETEALTEESESETETKADTEMSSETDTETEADTEMSTNADIEDEVDDEGWTWTDVEDLEEGESESELDGLEGEAGSGAGGTAAAPEVSDPEADLETSEDWEESVAGVELTGIWANDLSAIAATQIGVRESDTNFVIDENGERKGITRYGQWYGEPYADWSGMFVSFCLNYAEVPHSSVPRSGKSESLVRMLEMYDIYEDPAEYEPTKGDLVIMDMDEDGTPDHMGIVEEVTDVGVGGLSVVAGDVDNEVKYAAYAKDDPRIMGYGMLPQKPKERVYNRVYNDGKVMVRAEFTAEAGIPEDAVLIATEMPQTDEMYQQHLETVQAMLDAQTGEHQEIVPYGSVEEEDGSFEVIDDETSETEKEETEPEHELYMRVYNIGFYVDEQEFEPQAEVKISLEFFDDPNFAEGANAVIHMVEDGEPESLEVTNTEEEGTQTKMIEFSTSSL